MSDIDDGNDISKEAEENKKLNKDNSKQYQNEPNKLIKAQSNRSVKFADNNEEIEHIPNKEEHSNIKVIKGKVLSVTEDDEVYKELQFIINEKKEVTHLILKSSEITDDKVRIERELKSYKNCDFANIHDQNLGDILKNDAPIIVDEKIVIRPENDKLLFIQDSNDKNFTRMGEDFSKDMNLVEHNGKFFLNEDLGPKINSDKGKENLNKLPIKSALLKEAQAIGDKFKKQPTSSKQQPNKMLNNKEKVYER